jgi:hypothetical protein
MKLWRMKYPSYNYLNDLWVWILAPDRDAALRLYSAQVLGEYYDWTHVDAWEHLQDMSCVEYPLDQARVLPSPWQRESWEKATR